MALTDFKPHFDNSYQEVFLKTIVSKEVANTRFKSTLSYGESLERVAYDISGVAVRNVTRGSAATIDSVTDSSELITINLERQAVFHISDGEVKQAGPLNPGTVIGGKIARKVAIDLDAKFFAQVRNASYDFDTGDLTTLVSNGTPFDLTPTTVPQMIARMNAKLIKRNSISTDTNMCLVIDAYAASDIEEYLLSKSIDLAGYVFKNGYAGTVKGAEMRISENLTGEIVLGMATNPTDTNTITFNGVTVTFVGTLTGATSEVHIASTVDITRANLVAWLNAYGAAAEAEATDTGYSAGSIADQGLLQGCVATNDNAADTATIILPGSGRIVASETFTDATDTWGANFIHAYYGKKGAIDMVVQDIKEVDMRVTADRRGTNVFTHYLAGIKTFADGAKQFLDVMITA